MTATADIARFITQARYVTMPAAAIALARTGIIDSSGLAIAGGALPAGALLVRYVRSLGGPPEAAVIGNGFRAPAAHAAWANGTLISSLNWADSSFLGDVWHPTPVLWPTLFALAESNRCSGRQLLEAYVAGFEVGARLALAWAGHYDLGWLGTATIGTLASTAAAARMLDLTEHQTRMALGIACDYVSGTKQSMGAMHAQSAGKAARDGVIAASLARLGYTGDANGLDGPESISALLTRNRFDPAQLSAGLGTEYTLTRPGGLLLKYYPSGHLSHWCIDATLQLAREHDIRAGEVEEVTCIMPGWFVDTLRHHRPRTVLEAKNIVEYPVAAALLYGKVDASVMTEAHVQSPEAQRLMARISCLRDPDGAGSAESGQQAGQKSDRRSGDHPNTVIIRLGSGASYRRTLRFPKGDARNPLSHAELWGKFSDCAARVLAPAAIREAFGLLQGLDALEDLSDLATLLMG
jgi:2-methylcitrate dehydratase PrpD